MSTHGHHAEEAGKKITWGDRGLTEAQGVSPLDAHNVRLLDEVHPHKWVNPEVPDDFVYDLIAVGAGAGGLVSARMSARRGARSALIEKHLAGGDCLNHGCVPSKALLRSAKAFKAAKDFKKGSTGGKIAGDVTIDFGEVMTRMRKLRAKIAPVDSHERTATIGADMYQGEAKFTSPSTIEVNGKTLRFRKAVIATGGRPRVPPIPGLEDVPYHTNYTLFNLATQPKHMVIIGGGPIGVEMAFAFGTMGTQVTIVDISPVILGREDDDVRQILVNELMKAGVSLVNGVKKMAFSKGEGASSIVSLETATGEAKNLVTDCLLLATGRQPNVEGIGLEAAGVEFSTRTGVEVSACLQSTNPNIFAVGDCHSKYQFTHVAGMQAQMVVDNALFNGLDGKLRSMADLAIPWVTYTSPEVAAVQCYEGIPDRADVDTYKSSLEHVDRSILDGQTDGFVKIHCKKGTDVILGATIVAPNAGEMISELTVAIQYGIGLKQLQRTIHPYPTVSDSIGGAGFQCMMKTWKMLPQHEADTARTARLQTQAVAAADVALKHADEQPTKRPKQQ